MSSPILSTKYLQADILQSMLTNQVNKSNPALELARPAISRILSFTLGIGVTSTILLSINLSSAVAQLPSLPQQRLLSETTSQVNMLFVNPDMGDDNVNNGSESAPVKTITQALKLATANTVIVLSPGTYSADTGESFPLLLKTGVSIQGDARTQGQGITIQGGGGFLSRSFGGQNVTLIGANQAKLTGVTVTNPNPRGYGLWIESSNPLITENTFTGNTQDGISITGNSTATISKNYFHRNGANGITIGGSSQPQVRENVFEQTGFGINITQNAAPMVVRNQIQNNRSGIIVQANARPILRNNLIQGSQEDGLVAIAQAIPNLGTVAEPGGNEFRNNTRHEINASAAKEVIPAAGNTLAQNRVTGQVDFNAQIAPIAENSPPATVANRVIQDIPVNGEITFAAPSQPTQPVQPQMNYVKIDPNTVEFTAPASPPVNISPIQPLPTSGEPPFGESVLQANPNGNLPIGTPGNLQPAPATPTRTTALPPANVQQRGVRYRVVVNVTTDRERDMVRNLAPGAFPTIRQGRRVMQAGVFSNRQNADEIVSILNSNGLKTIIEPLN